jgi:hypothetical protein
MVKLLCRNGSVHCTSPEHTYRERERKGRGVGGRGKRKRDYQVKEMVSSLPFSQGTGIYSVVSS